MQSKNQLEKAQRENFRTKVIHSYLYYDYLYYDSVTCIMIHSYLYYDTCIIIPVLYTVTCIMPLRMCTIEYISKTLLFKI